MKPKRNLIQFWLLCAVMLPAAVQAQYNYTINNGTIIITEYTGPGGDVIIPSSIYVPALSNSLPVTSIGGRVVYNGGDNYAGAFKGCFSLTNITIPDSVTIIDYEAFENCPNLNRVTIPNSVTTIGDRAFYVCSGLTNVMIGNGVTTIGENAFAGCISLTNVTFGTNITSIGFFAFGHCPSLNSMTIPNSVTSIGQWAFYNCSSLTTVYFKGNAPTDGGDVFIFANNVVVYYLPGTTNWPTVPNAWSGRPTALWLPQAQTSDGSFGGQTNGFGFNITWASGQTVVVESCTNLANPTWFPLQTNTFTDDSFYFSDSKWTNYPGRYYRLRSP